MQLYAKEDIVNITYCLDRLHIFMQAPAKKSEAGLHAFLASKVHALHLSLVDCYYNAQVLQAMSILNQLSNMVLLIQAEVTKSDVTAMLDNRLELAMQYYLASNDEKLSSFWKNEWQQNEEWCTLFLEKKASLAVEPFDAALLTQLRKRLKNEQLALPDAEACLADKFYWQILSQNETITYTNLASALHGASKVDYGVLNQIVAALLDRIALLQVDEAKPALEDMLSQKSPILLFQDAVESWFYVQPQKALSYMFSSLEEECNALQTDPSLDSFTARTDYHLVVHLLSIFLKKDSKGMLMQVYQDLMKKVSWFTAKDKKDLDFFTMSLELSWLKELLTEQAEGLEGITNTVDVGVDFQKKTMILLRYAQEPNFQATLDLLSQMQERLTNIVSKALDDLPKKGPKIKQVIALISDAETNAKTQNQELASMQAVQDDLEQASKILHSLKSESQSQSQQSQSNAESKSSDLSKEMQQKALKLAPELSIRLLQQMEKDDRSLETQNIPQVTGTRPW